MSNTDQLNIEKLELAPLEALPFSLHSDERTKKRDDGLKNLEKWRKDYRFWLRLPEKYPGRSFKLRFLGEQKLDYLLEMDTYCSDICQHDGLQYALEAADHARQYLSAEPDDEEKLLTMWTKPSDNSMDRLPEMMGVRVLLAMARVVVMLCAPQRLNLKMAHKQAKGLASRLDWCPLARAHWDDLSNHANFPKYTLPLLGTADADRLHNRIEQKFGPRDRMLMYIWAHIVETFGKCLFLPAAVKEAEMTQAALVSAVNMETNAATQLKVKVDQFIYEEQLLPFKTKWSEWCPGFGASEKDNITTCDQTQIEEFAGKWGYGNINLNEDPMDIASLLWNKP